LLEAAESDPPDVVDVVLVGNSVMHHLFCDLDLSPLAHYPFESATLGEYNFRGTELDWLSLERARVRFLPCIGGYVGSDILAGVVATGMHRSKEIVALVDLGTNGEIVLGNRDRLVCSSTAAGPAFEGARIFMGMRASTGAISEVHVEGGNLTCHVLGNVSPKGICGSGLVDAVAACLDLGLIQSNGRLSQKTGYLTLCSPVRLSQTDIRELQLAKGAIAAGIRILMDESGLKKEQLSAIYLAGAFGNYINIASAGRIGLIPFPEEMVEASGNTALLGGKMSLFADDDEFSQLAGSIEHISLHAHPLFQDIYIEEMSFPGEPQPSYRE
ncbi:MAG: ASKHA domain-containing protein, partial [Bacteroidota bacterium]